MNILLNSCLAIRKKQEESGKDNKGTVTIRTKTQEDMLVIEFEDTGCGISPENREKVFEPFFTIKPAKGVGLGLSIVYRIIQAHKGQITVNSELGTGSCFRISIPIS